MKSLVFSSAALAVLLCLVAASAAADQCQTISGRLGPGQTYYGPCAYDGEAYETCIDTPIRGTINGVWHLYAPENNWIVSFQAPPYSSPVAGWALDVLETSRGMIYAQDNWLWNLSMFDLEGTRASFPTVSISFITGGTGKYEGASGWIGFIVDEPSDWRGFVKGELCLP